LGDQEGGCRRTVRSIRIQAPNAITTSGQKTPARIQLSSPRLPELVLEPGEPRSWARRPVVMPEGREGVEVDRIWVRGRPARLLAGTGTGG
jgi:hypothetical protein